MDALHTFFFLSGLMTWGLLIVGGLIVLLVRHWNSQSSGSADQ